MKCRRHHCGKQAQFAFSPGVGLSSGHENNRHQPSAISHLKAFWEQCPDAEQSLLAWIDEGKKADWKSPVEIKEKLRSASILRSRRVVFDIKGNDYRLVIAVTYRFCGIYIKFIGTHRQHDAIAADTVEMK